MSAWIGVALGMSSGVLIAFSGPLVYRLYIQSGVNPHLFNVDAITEFNPANGVEFKTCEDPISFQWIGPISLIVGLSSDRMANLVFPHRDVCFPSEHAKSP